MDRRARTCPLWLSGLLVLAVGATIVPAQGTIVYSDFSSTTGLSLVGSATRVGDRLRLTPSAPLQAGGAWFAERQSVADGFDTTFQFAISSLVLEGADGFAFVLQNDSATSLAFTGGDIGYSGPPPAHIGIPYSIALEFDTYHNAELGDPNNNHLSVHTRGPIGNSAEEIYSLGSTTVIPNLSDGQVHTALVSYRPGTFSVFVDDLTTPALVVPLNLGATLSLADGAAWVGFTLGTGIAGYEAHDILSWRLASVPEPSTWALLLSGAGLLGWRRRLHGQG